MSLNEIIVRLISIIRLLVKSSEDMGIKEKMRILDELKEIQEATTDDQ